MNEEQAVLDFFAKKENLTLGLSVAELMDSIRIEMNSSFWEVLLQRLNSQLEVRQKAHDMQKWEIIPTKDRGDEDVLVGLHYRPVPPQTICLFPMLEQQYISGVWRILHGLMWSIPPTPEHLALPAVSDLKQLLLDAGFRSNENFLAWQWTAFYPRRRDFLTSYSQNPDAHLGKLSETFNILFYGHWQQIINANNALSLAPRSIPVSLTNLHRKHV